MGIHVAAMHSAECLCGSVRISPSAVETDEKTLSDHAHVGDSLTVELPALDRSILVQIQVPQPIADVYYSVPMFLKSPL